MESKEKIMPRSGIIQLRPEASLNADQGFNNTDQRSNNADQGFSNVDQRFNSADQRFHNPD